MGSVLLVDDDDAYREALRGFLEAEGFEVVEARNGCEALALARVTRPAAIISDLTMPEMDGVTLMEHLQADPLLASIPLLILSAQVVEPLDGHTDGLVALPKGADPEEITYSLRVRHVAEKRAASG